MNIAALAVVTLAMAPACVVGEPADDAVAGDGLAASDMSGTNGSGVGTIAARVCPNGPTTKGIDVSYYQGTIDWQSVKAGGIDFAFIRLSDGDIFHDPKFDTNWAAARSAGVIRGAYQFFRPGQDVDMQADMMIEAIGTYEPGDLPPVLDVEATGGLSAKSVATRVKAWAAKVKGALGVDPMIYSGKYFWRDQVGGERALASNALWIAQYTTLCPDLPSPWTRWTFWQNSSSGYVAGIKGKVDLDKFNGTADDLLAFAKGTTPAQFDQAALPFYWTRSDYDDTYSFIASPPPGVTRVEVRVEDYLIGASAPSGSEAIIDYQFNVERAGRDIDVRGFDDAGAVIAVGNGLVDSTQTPEIYVDQTGDMTYEIGLEDPYGAATVEVNADGYPLMDAVSGRFRSTRGAVEFGFTQSGIRELSITSRDSTGAILMQDTRTLSVR